MQAEIPLPPLTRYLVPPPYTRFEPMGRLTGHRPAEVRRGTLLALEVSHPDEDWRYGSRCHAYGGAFWPCRSCYE